VGTGHCPNTDTEHSGCAYGNGDQRPVRVAILAAVRLRRTIRIVASPSGGGIGSGGTGRQWRNSGDGARLHTDLAPIIICDGCSTARTDHDRVADIGVDAAGDRVKSSALIDGEIAIAWLDRGRPGRARHKHGAAKRYCAAKRTIIPHPPPQETLLFITPFDRCPNSLF
jgi:hypothetical protein